MVDQEGRTEAHYAALENDSELLQSLLASGHGPDDADRSGFTPLHFAAQENALEAARILVQAGAQIDSANKFGNTPLWTAVFNARDSEKGGLLIRLLLASGADPDHANGSGSSPRDHAKLIANYDLMPYFE